MVFKDRHSAILLTQCFYMFFILYFLFTQNRHAGAFGKYWKLCRILKLQDRWPGASCSEWMHRDNMPFDEATAKFAGIKLSN